MNKLIIGIVIFLVLVGVFFIFSNPTEESAVQQNNNEQSSSNYETIKQEMTTGSSYMYDVRTPEEYANGHIEEATLFSLQDMQSGQYPEVSKDATIYVYCRSGSRSAQAKSLLDKQGYTDVVDLGSYADVQKLGGNLVQ